MERKRLTRSDREKILAGVCGGIGEYLGLDANVVRVVFLVLVLIQPATLLLYLLLALLLPRSGEEDQDLQERLKAGARELEERFESESEGRLWLGVGLIALGVVLLAGDLGLIWLDWRWLGALALVVAGVYLLFLKGE
ncbi:PspC domain-containing protein [Oceanithermus sp.]